MMSLDFPVHHCTQYDMAFAPGETGENLEKRAPDIFTTALPPLHLQF